MSIHEDTGISIEVEDTLVNLANGKFNYFMKLTHRIKTYEHEITDREGFNTATISFPVPKDQIDDWFENGLTRRITTRGEGGAKLWRGFVNELEIVTGGDTMILGPILDIGNRVSAVYALTDFSVYPPNVGTETETTIEEDADSQDKYGIIEKIISIGQAETAAAEQVRGVALKELKDPKQTGDITLPPSNFGDVTLHCLGLVHWLSAYVYNNTATTFSTLSEKIVDILTADPNGFISTNYDDIESNSFAVWDNEINNRFALDIISDLLGLGEASADEPVHFGCYEDDQVVYGTIPTEVEYLYKIAEGRIRTVKQGLIMPWEVRPAKWLKATDFLVGRIDESSPGSNVNIREDPRNRYIKSVRYSAPFTVSLSGAPTDRLANLLAKITYTGGFI